VRRSLPAARKGIRTALGRAHIPSGLSVSNTRFRQVCVISSGVLEDNRGFIVNAVLFASLLKVFIVF
jgi:hypothetical protein